MKRRTVIVLERAIDDLENMHQLVSERAGRHVADGFVSRIRSFILGLDVASERGTLRKDVRKGLRIVGFERKITIAFSVAETEVHVLRVFWGGRNWEQEFQ